MISLSFEFDPLLSRFERIKRLRSMVKQGREGESVVSEEGEGQGYVNSIV